MNTSPSQLTDAALLAEVKRLARCERETIATLVAHLVEVEVRDLHRTEGCSSMFTYCTEVLRYSEDATVVRLQAARAARQHPEILTDLASGALHLSGLRLLAPYLAPEVAKELLTRARHKSKREVEKLVRERFPLPDVPAVVLKLPVARPAMPVQAALAVGPEPVVALVEAPPLNAPQLPAPAPGRIAPLAAERYKVQFTATADMHDLLRRAQDLLRHRVPSGDLGQVFELALAVLVEKLEKQKLAATDRPRVGSAERAGGVGNAGRVGGAGRTGGEVAQRSRTIPAAVKREVWRRDGGRCAFVAKSGRRCSATGFLEFHHVVAFARGGEPTVANIALRCRSHNQYEGRIEFGAFDPFTVRESSASWGSMCASDPRREAELCRERLAPWGEAERDVARTWATCVVR